MTSHPKKRSGEITVEIELEKSLSHGRRVSIKMDWEDMLDLPLSTDRLSVDRVEVELMNGPADDEVLLDRPNSLVDFTWQGIFRNKEWLTIEAFTQTLRQDRRVREVRVLR